MAKIDHAKRSALERMSRYGVDNIADMSLPRGLTPPKKRQSKADARQELEALMSEFKNGKPAAPARATGSMPNHTNRKAGR
ncbi:hypothetical protein [Paenochrobactrum glaciei]|uniref:Uncharacterized protein n=1 Tax=Paenochrobactrum glaciei TaxID=486407 RepID=A0ABN1GBE1_9HYPH